MKKIYTKILNYCYYRFANESLPIKHRLSNLIILFTLLGSCVCFIASLLVNQNIWSTIAITVATIVIAFCLYLSAWKLKARLAAFCVIFIIDEIIFPFLFVTCGGIHSGMTCWFIVGLIFPFLVMDGIASVVLFFLAFGTLALFFAMEYLNLITIVPLEGIGWVEDVVQSIAIVSVVLGIIFKFQTNLYSKQNEILEQKESDLREAIKEAHAANHAKSDFLANMSHEIRTPINAIMGLNEIILRDCKDETITQNSIKIQAASSNLLSIINDILDFSKIEAGKMEIINSEYALSSIINDCYNMVHLRAFNKGLSLKITNNPDTPEHLLGDEYHIRQVITNLLTNGVKYTKEGSVTLDISYDIVDMENINLVIKVTDTGVGICKEDQDKLFKSFQRIDERHNRTIEGTGLGLIITKRLIDQMGGNISFESEEGKGSTFTAIIPQKPTDGTVIGDFTKRYLDYEKQTATDYHEKFTSPDAKLLVVDDTQMNLTVVRGLLKPTQIVVDTALSGAEALELTNENKYDVILLDHMMPEMDGIETLHNLKALNNINKDTPVIMLTANAIKGAEEQYLSEGFDDYLSKPVRGKDLEEMIYKYLPKDKIKL